MRQTNISFGLILARANRGEERKEEEEEEVEEGEEQKGMFFYWKHVYCGFLV